MPMTTITALLLKLTLAAAYGPGVDTSDPHFLADQGDGSEYADCGTLTAAPVEIVRIPILRAAPVEIVRIPILRAAPVEIVRIPIEHTPEARLARAR
jgi:hypothetical protein